MKKINFRKIIEISLIVIAVYLICISKNIAGTVFLSVFTAYLLNPIVNFMVKHKMNKRIASIITISIFIGFFVLIFIYIIPMLTRDIPEMLKNLNVYTQKLFKGIESKKNYSMPEYLKRSIDGNMVKADRYMTNYLNSSFAKLISITMQIPTYALAPIFIYYFLVDKDYFLSKLKFFIPINIRNKTIKLGNEIEKVIGSFIKDQIILAIIVTALTFGALVALNIKYALLLGLINGFANFIPYFGIVLGFLPALFFAASISVQKVIFVSIAYFIIQQVESNIIAPKLMSESMGLHPATIVIVLLLGGKFFGAIGLLISVPIAGAIKVTYDFIIENLY